MDLMRRDTPDIVFERGRCKSTEVIVDEIVQLFRCSLTNNLEERHGMQIPSRKTSLNQASLGAENGTL